MLFLDQEVISSFLSGSAQHAHLMPKKNEEEDDEEEYEDDEDNDEDDEDFDEEDLDDDEYDDDDLDDDLDDDYDDDSEELDDESDLDDDEDVVVGGFQEEAGIDARARAACRPCRILPLEFAGQTVLSPGLVGEPSQVGVYVRIADANDRMIILLMEAWRIPAPG